MDRNSGVDCRDHINHSTRRMTSMSLTFKMAKTLYYLHAFYKFLQFLMHLYPIYSTEPQLPVFLWLRRSHWVAEGQSWMPCGQKLLGSGSVWLGGRLFGGRCCVGDICWEASGIPGEDIPNEVSYHGTCWKAAHGGGALGSDLYFVRGRCPLEVPLKLAAGEHC